MLPGVAVANKNITKPICSPISFSKARSACILCRQRHTPDIRPVLVSVHNIGSLAVTLIHSERGEISSNNPLGIVRNV